MTQSEDSSQVMNMDWDVLVILDACRYDVFDQIYTGPGSLSAISWDSTTSDVFLTRNFLNKTFHDTVYVSANPKVTKNLPDQTFHAVISAWAENWSEEHESVVPEDVTELALEAAKQYPNKRLVVHYMQPHQPFVGPKGHEFMKQHNLKGFHNPQSERDREMKLYNAMRHGLLEVSDAELEDLYRENLEVALDSVEKLLQNVEGKTIITGDHGELLGEKVGPLPVSGYGHYGSFHVKELLEVPWLEIESGSRREVYEDQPIDNPLTENEDMINDRLESLGYL